MQLLPHLGPFLSPVSLQWEMIFVGPSAGSGEVCRYKSLLCHTGKMTQISPKIIFFGEKISNSTLFVLKALLGSQAHIWYFGSYSQGNPVLPTSLRGREVSSQLLHPHRSHHSEGWMSSPPTRGNWPLELLAALVSVSPLCRSSIWAP